MWDLCHFIKATVNNTDAGTGSIIFHTEISDGYQTDRHTQMSHIINWWCSVYHDTLAIYKKYHKTFSWSLKYNVISDNWSKHYKSPTLLDADYLKWFQKIIN